MKRIKIDLEMAEGSRYQQPFIWKSGDTLATVVPVDITGYTAEMQIRAKSGDAEPLLSLSTSAGGLTITNQTLTPGRYEIDIPDEDSQGICLPYHHRDIKGVYDLYLIDAAGKYHAHQYGQMLIRAAITRPWEV